MTKEHRLRSIVIWTAVALVGAVAWGVIALVARRGDLRGLAGRRRARLVRDRLPLLRPLHRHAVLEVDDSRATPAERLDNGVDFQPTDRRVLLRPPLRRHRRRRAAGRPGARRADGLPARHDLDHRRRDLRRRRAGHGDPVLLDAPRRQEPRARWPARRSARSAAWPRWSRVFAIMIILLAVLALVVVNALAAVAVGHLLDRDDHPDRPVHGLLPARAAARPGDRDHRHRRRACCCSRSSPAAGSRSSALGRHVHPRARDAGLLPGGLRLRRLGAAGVDAAGDRATTCRRS